jgi:hypothetical protein
MSLKRVDFAFGIFLAVFSLTAGIIAMSHSEKRQDFAIDFPKYIGWTIDSMVTDIGVVPEYSDVYYLDIHGISYTGCLFVYPPGVRVTVQFDSMVNQPPGRHDIIRDANYFRNERIRSLDVYINCSSMDQK